MFRFAHDVLHQFYTSVVILRLHGDLALSDSFASSTTDNSTGAGLCLDWRLGGPHSELCFGALCFQHNWTVGAQAQDLLDWRLRGPIFQEVLCMVSVNWRMFSTALELVPSYTLFIIFLMHRQEQSKNYTMLFLVGSVRCISSCPWQVVHGLSNALAKSSITYVSHATVSAIASGYWSGPAALSSYVSFLRLSLSSFATCPPATGIGIAFPE